MTAVNLLREGRRQEAAELIATFEAALDRPQGVSLPWDDLRYRDSFAADLDMVAEAWPAILGDQPADVVAAIRLRALIGSAFGDEGIATRLGIEAPHVRNLDADAAARMVMFHVSHLTNVASWRAVRIAEAEISTALECCDECDRLRGRYKVSELPVLPYVGCTSKEGCCCMALPVP